MFQTRTPSNNLSKSIAERNWSDVHRHVNEASLQNSDNGYALHDVCSDPSAPIQIVKDIYFAYPHAALAKDDDQHTPLCIAVDFEFEGAVEFLVNECTEDMESCASYLRSAVHSLSCTNIIDSFVTVNPKVAFVTDKNGNSTFDLFFRIWNVPMRIGFKNENISGVLDNEIGQGNWTFRDVYQKACLFLSAANFRQNAIACANACLVHAAMREESCHLAFCELLMKLHPEQVLGRDADGNLPIHIIASAKDLSDEKSFLCIDCSSNKSKLVHMEYLDGGTNYCCVDCLARESRQSIRRAFCLEPGKLYFNKISFNQNPFSFIISYNFSLQST